MNRWIKWDEKWLVKGNGERPEEGAVVDVTKADGRTDKYTIHKVVVTGGNEATGERIWLAEVRKVKVA